MRDHFHDSATAMRQIDAPIPLRPRGTVVIPISDQQRPGEIPRSPITESSDQSLIRWCRAGDQDAATQLFHRYHKRLTGLVKRRCSLDLARCAGVEDIVQSIFATFFRRVGQGFYDIADGEVAWKVLLIIALNKVRNQATYYFADKRDAHRTIGGAEARKRLRFQGDTRAFAPGHFELVLKEVLERLPFRTEMLVRMRIDGFTFEEIARIAGRSRRTVERVIHETRLTLSELLLKED
jgi:RNA polymerase sigma factor (sigma-70 family)